MNTLRDRLVDDIGCAWRWFTTWLNVIGTGILLYIMQTPNAPGELIQLFPAVLQPIVKVLLPLVWFMLVQGARSVKQKPPGA